MDPLLNPSLRGRERCENYAPEQIKPALAFISLGRERKRDITVFYAFLAAGSTTLPISAQFDAAQKANSTGGMARDAPWCMCG